MSKDRLHAFAMFSTKKKIIRDSAHLSQNLIDMSRLSFLGASNISQIA